MEFADLLTPEGVIASLRAGSKKQALQDLASHAAKLCGIPPEEIFAALRERERLGATGIGQGFAIPHCKLPGLDRVQGVFARLENPVNFDAADDLPVDLIFLLLAPESAGGDHLKFLARISRLSRNQDLVQKLRATDEAAALYALLTEPAASAAA